MSKLSNKKAECYKTPLCEVSEMDMESTILDSSFESGDMPTWGEDGYLDF